MARSERQISEVSDQTVAVAFFRPYPFLLGQRIYIDSGPRRGDWEVIDVDENHVRLRCPVSGREVTWTRFCYLIWEGLDESWPHFPAAE
jgi:hypothetical protein